MNGRAATPDRVLQLDDAAPTTPIAVNDLDALANEAQRQIGLYDQALTDELTWMRTLAVARDDLSLAKSGPWTRLGPGGELIVNGKNAEQRDAQVRQALESDPTYVRARKAAWDAEREIADAERRAKVADRSLELQMQLLRCIAAKAAR